MPGQLTTRSLLVLGLASGCTAQPSAAPPTPVYSAPTKPDPVERAPSPVLGLNGPCPALRVFTDEADLCLHGIEPIDEFGTCLRLPAAPNPDERPRGRNARLGIDEAALGGRVQIYANEYFRSSYNTDSYYLALQRPEGVVLLGELERVYGYTEDTPVLAGLVGGPAQLEITLHKNVSDRDGTQEQTVETITRCTLDPDGAIRCNGACPSIALDRPLAPLDCGALASFDWSTLPAGEDSLDDWGGVEEVDELDVASRFLGIDDGPVEPLAARSWSIARVRLSAVSPAPGRWALMRWWTPLLSSDDGFRVGPGPGGGLFVVSESEGERRVHRLNLETNELEPVLPGACG